MMDEPDEFVVHREPVWRNRADFVISAELPEGDRPKQFEQLWARQLGEREFETCCIPFFIYDVALGDIVRTSPKKGRRYVVDSVVRPSGRYVFRVWFGESFHPREQVADDVARLGALLEWSSTNLLALDAEDIVRAQAVADYLDRRERRGDLVFDAGRSA
jgi:hypothetical protein